MKSCPVCERIHSDPEIMGGARVFKGTRITVEWICNLINKGISIEELKEEYPQLTPEDFKIAFLLNAFKDIKYE